MTEQRLKVESGPPAHMISDSGHDAPSSEHAQSATESAKDKAQAVAGQAKDKAAAQVGERSTQLGQQIGTQAQSLDGVAEELRRQGRDGPAKIAEQVGQRVKDVGGHLEQADGASLVTAALDAARENPAAAAAAGAAAGFVAGRLLKASGDDGTVEEDKPAVLGDGGQ
jgi:hypothetical protein